MNSIFKLTFATALPVIVAIAFYLLDKKTKFGNLNNKIKQIIYGVVFGGLAIFGTEWGIPFNGAQANCRDGAVLIAGLMFGAPAGIIAGVIGGVERAIAINWGVGTYTVVACSVSTCIAGLYSAALRKFMFEDKKPGFLISLAIGVVMEVFHLTMVFITNMDDPVKAMSVVKACTLPMVLANSLSVFVASIALSLLASGKNMFKKRTGQVRISQTIQGWLLGVVLVAFAVTSIFVGFLQDRLADEQTNSVLDTSIDEIAEDIKDTSDSNLLAQARIIESKINESAITLESIAGELAELPDKLSDETKTKITEVIVGIAGKDISEISISNKNGIIVASSVPEFVGFDFHSGEQSREFLCLLEGEDEFVQEYGQITIDDSISRKYAGIKISNGFLQVGYDAELFQKSIDNQIKTIAKNRAVGNTGYILILDKQFNTVSSPKNLPIDNLAISNIDVKEDVMFEYEINGENSYCRYRNVEGYFVTAILPESEAMQARDIAIYVNTFMEILVFAILFALVYLLIKKVVVNQIMKINDSLAKITGGDLGVVINVRSNEEFASLSDDINSTVDTLKHYIDEASARIDAELEFAKNIQASALPSVFPAFPKRKDLDMYAMMDPAKEVGGDFYDFYITGTDKLNFLIADVSGKGIPAAMFMMRAKTELKSLTETEMPIGDVFTTGNKALCEGNDAGMFVTAWQGGIDLTTGKIEYANAGHNPPLVKHVDGKFEYLRSRAGFVLAGMEGVKYKPQELQLERGDIIYLYTDGVTEATNAQNELFGEERLLETINSQEFDDMQSLCKYVKGKVDEFVGDAPQFDDITMVALKFIGTPPAPSITFDNATIEDIPTVTEFVETELEKIDCSMKTVVQINVAIDEIFSNIVKYAYPNQSGFVNVKVIIKDDPKEVCVRFTDEGIPYNPLTKEDPDITLSADERDIGGLGIFLVKKTMDDVKYKYEGGQNILTIKKYL